MVAAKMAGHLQFLRCVRLAVFSAGLLHPLSALANDDAAHAIADQFSRASAAEAQEKVPEAQPTADDALARKLQQEERLRADEAEMLARAKAEAAERKAAEEAARDAAAKEAASLRRAADEARKAADEAKAAALRAKEEQRRIAEEKAEAERQAVLQEKVKRERAEAAQAAQAQAEAAKAEQLRIAEEKRLQERRAQEASERQQREEAERLAEAAKAEQLKSLEAERAAEAARLSEKLRRAREQRETKLEQGYSALGNPPPSPVPRTAPDTQTPALAAGEPALPTPTPMPALRGTDTGRETRATILLVMEKGTRGIRKYDKSADPILCVGDACYVSNGPDEPATQMVRARAFGPGQTLGQRAGACRKSLTCVFRGVVIESARVDVQPVDLRLLRHDRRETQSVGIDTSCIAAAGHLRCSAGIVSRSYRLWVVPESVAVAAGDSALSAAVNAGLPASDATALRN